MEKPAQVLYQELMNIIRDRLDVIDALSKMPINSYSKSEIAAFHGRKIIEAIAFGCLVCVRNGLRYIPKDAHGQYNAETIIKSFIKKGIDIFPSPSEIRYATEAGKNESHVDVIVQGIPDRRITKEELIKIYQRMHNWLHELNPYTKEGQEVFHQKNSEQLWSDLENIKRFLQSHIISIKGEAFLCVLKDKTDGLTKVASLSKSPN